MTKATLTAADLYLRLKQIIEDMPPLRGVQASPELHSWLGRAFILVEAAGDMMDTVSFRTAVNNIFTVYSRSPEDIPVILYRSLARAEAQAPISVKGTFIPVGKPLDALMAVTAVFKEATSDVLVVDPYADESLFSKFLPVVPEGISIRILSDAKFLKVGLKPAAEAWIAQYGSLRPLEVRKTAKGLLHDRVIILDGKIAWSVGQSFNHLAERSPTTLGKVDADTTSLKIPAYEDMWKQATSL